jgi:hypothetical protein
VQCRVASGRAYESQRSQRNISSLRWNHSNNVTTEFGETDDTHGGTRVSEFSEVSDIPQASSMA